MTLWDKVKSALSFRRPAHEASAPRDEVVSITDPRFAEFIGLWPDYAGVEVTERTVMGLSAVYRASTLIAGSLAGLPLNTLRDQPDGTANKVTSMFDDPGSVVGLQRFNWTEMQVLHLLLHGDAFLYKIFNAAGALVGLRPIHPLLVGVRWNDNMIGGKEYTIPTEDGLGSITADATQVVQIMGPSTDGLRGMSVVALARTSLGGAIAGDRAAAKLFSNGALMGGVVTPAGTDYLSDPDEAKLDAYLQRKAAGWENNGAAVFINRPLNFSAWSMALKDAQFLESRQFSIQEIARWFGVPGSELMDPGSVSTWGTGVEIQQRGLSRGTLAFWAGRMEQAYTACIAGQRYVKFDFHGLERGSPADEVALINAKIDAGLMTINEGRAALGMPGVGPDGDILRYKGVPISMSPAKAVPITPPTPAEEPAPGEETGPTSAPPAPQTRVPAPPAAAIRELVDA